MKITKKRPDPKLTRGAHITRESLRRKIRREMSQQIYAGTAYCVLWDLLQWVLTAKPRASKRPGGL